MAINKKDIERFEKENKDYTYKRISNIISRQTKTINAVQKLGKNFNVHEGIPNIGITLNNKMNEISEKFEDAGISMFFEQIDENDTVKMGLVGKAIREDLFSRTEDSMQPLYKYCNSLEEKVAQKMENVNGGGYIRQQLLRIKEFFSPGTMERLITFSQDEKKETSKYLEEYRENDDKLHNYNLDENLKESILKYIKQRNYSSDVIPEFLEEAVEPTLRKLGLEHLVPEMQEQLDRENEHSKLQSSKSWELPPERRTEIQEKSAKIGIDFSKKLSEPQPEKKEKNNLGFSK